MLLHALMWLVEGHSHHSHASVKAWRWTLDWVLRIRGSLEAVWLWWIASRSRSHLRWHLVLIIRRIWLLMHFLSFWSTRIAYSISLRIPNDILPLPSFLIFLTASILLNAFDDLFWLHTILKQIGYHGRWLDLSRWHHSNTLVARVHSLL